MNAKRRWAASVLCAGLLVYSLIAAGAPGSEGATKLFSAAALLPVGESSTFVLPVEWPVSSIHLGGGAVVLEAFFPAEKRVTLHWRDLEPTVLTVLGEASHRLELLLVPDRGGRLVANPGATVSSAASRTRSKLFADWRSNGSAS